MKKFYILALFSIFVLAFFLRTMYLPQKALTFGYDQARDAYVSQQILKGDFKILGPPSSTPGLYHGVFYYYLLAPAYYLGNGNPIVAAYWIALLNSLTIFIVFYFALKFSKSYKAAFLAGVFFAFSFEAVQYATWLSNPTIAIWTVPIAYVGLWLWVFEKKKFGAILLGLGLGLSVQAEIFLLYHLVPVLFWLGLRRKNIELKYLLLSLSVFLLSISSMIVSEVKFGFKSIGGIAHLASTQDTIAYGNGLGDIVVLYLNQLGRMFSYNTYPGNVGYGSIIPIVALITALVIRLKSKKKHESVDWPFFLTTWILSHATVVSLGGTSTPFLLVGIGPAVSILLGVVLYKLFNVGQKVLLLGLVCLILLGNLSMIIRENPRGQTIFAIQKDMLLSKQLSAINYTYLASNKQNFSINSLTSPLWINIVWTYLYKWHGQSEYGYIPSWHGKNQIGQIDSLPLDDSDTKNYYLILEPMGGIPLRYLDETVNEEDSLSTFVRSESFGELIIQKRIKKEKL